MSGLPPTAQQRLGQRVGERPHALAATGGQHHGLHDVAGRGAARLAPRALARGSAGTTRCSRKLAQRGSSRVARAGLAHVVERARQVGQVAGLAVAVPQAAEDAEHLEVPLHADEVEPAQELRVARAGRRRRARCSRAR